MEYKDHSHNQLDEGLLGKGRNAAAAIGSAVGGAAAKAGREVVANRISELGGKESAIGRIVGDGKKTGQEIAQERRTGKAANPEIGTDYVPSMTRTQQRRVREGEKPGGGGGGNVQRANRMAKAVELGQKKLDARSFTRSGKNLGSSLVKGAMGRVVQALPKSQKARVELAKQVGGGIKRGIGGKSPGDMKGIFANDAFSAQPTGRSNDAFGDQAQMRKQARELLQLDPSLTYGQALTAVMQQVSQGKALQNRSDS